MKTTGISRPVYLLPFAVLLALCLHPAGAWAMISPTGLVESKLGGGTILNSPADKLIATVHDCVKENPQRSGAIVAAVLNGGRADADTIAPQVTASAIGGLGDNPPPSAVGAIVYSSVKATPAVVLETVRAAVKAAPGCAKAIVMAAIKAVPDPNAKVPALKDPGAPAAQAEPPSDGLTKDDTKDDSKDGEQLVPIGEAIAQAANYPGPLTPDPSDPPTTYPGYYYPPLVNALPTPPVVSK